MCVLSSDYFFVLRLGNSLLGLHAFCCLFWFFIPALVVVLFPGFSLLSIASLWLLSCSCFFLRVLFFFLCVCQPLYLRVPMFPSRGHRPIVDTCANEAVPRWGMRRLITSVYLLNCFSSCHSTLPRCVSWWFSRQTPKLFPQPLSAAAR